MIRNSVVKVAIAAGLCLPQCVSAAERLNVRTGLWEISSVMQFSGVPPLPKEIRDNLTPEQLAKIVAEAEADAARGPARDTSRECITEKDLDQPFSSADTRDCRQTVVNTTRTSQEARIVCEGEHKGSGVLKVSTPTPETMSGTMELKMGEGPQAFTVKGRVNGRWLDADCGDEAEDMDDMESDDEPADDNEEEEE